MFYSHEILTSRKYGVATVWLVATLGQKSSLKRINRKQILEVDVPKACQTIVDPVAPMALRLQGNLLYVVTEFSECDATLTIDGV
ncbi:Rad21-Rec8 N terminal domain-containing protein [Pyrenophora tritici-repentis]|nr:Rad21-Rec8 N terminal domain-containing protein [Pyrenophora tritici-repentis]KAF7448853.1 Rad21-Rec8 N terminal domain-containing protein [Pyrenophora tritici-repentis]KAI1540691.1 Rad21 Rec8 N terminal domain-containing protein [Pyrenophora tritici-repentis]KAI1571342.1 Rad21 Rec8 N terminal domain-containing protein [Pyrenophora tritici-repentis]KAI1580457.1 Rad21 Rec8 N terminal domain-containing protein [Pyrenophora tritici-repentis]